MCIGHARSVITILPQDTASAHWKGNLVDVNLIEQREPFFSDPPEIVLVSRVFTRDPRNRRFAGHHERKRKVVLRFRLIVRFYLYRYYS